MGPMLRCATDYRIPADWLQLMTYRELNPYRQLYYDYRHT
jgi:hypothetical protein